MLHTIYNMLSITDKTNFSIEYIIWMFINWKYNLKMFWNTGRDSFTLKQRWLNSAKYDIAFIKPSKVVLICWLICWLLTCERSRTISKRNFLVCVWGVICVRLCTGRALKACLGSVHWDGKTHFKSRGHHFLSLGLGLHAKDQANLLHHSPRSAFWLDASDKLHWAPAALNSQTCCTVALSWEAQ